MLPYVEPLPTCDLILDLFSETRTAGYNQSGIAETLGYTKGNPSAALILPALNKLETDDYLKRYGHNNEYYQITGDGLLFKTLGKYKAYIDRENARENLGLIIQDLGLKTNQSVIDTNKSVKETNDIQKKNIQWNNKLFWVTLAVAVIAATGTWMQVVNDRTKNSLSQKLEAKDSLQQQTERNILQIENARDVLQKEKDSLLKALNSLNDSVKRK
jgi:DNA-binding PadR family transcriptional regulator